MTPDLLMDSARLFYKFISLEGVISGEKSADNKESICHKLKYEKALYDEGQTRQTAGRTFNDNEKKAWSNTYITTTSRSLGCKTDVFEKTLTEGSEYYHYLTALIAEVGQHEALKEVSRIGWWQFKSTKKSIIAKAGETLKKYQHNAAEVYSIANDADLDKNIKTYINELITKFGDASKTVQAYIEKMPNLIKNKYLPMNTFKKDENSELNKDMQRKQHVLKYCFRLLNIHPKTSTFKDILENTAEKLSGESKTEFYKLFPQQNPA